MKDIPGYEGLYAITEDGRVWSYPREWINGRGKIHKHNGKWLKFNNKKGYNTCTLRKNNKAKYYTVHRLVAVIYLANPNNYPQINHKNGIKTDNRVENLEWCTASYNQLHNIHVLGNNQRVLNQSGEDNYMAKLNDSSILEIKEKYLKGFTRTQLAKNYNCSRTLISLIIDNKIWKHTIQIIKRKDDINYGENHPGAILNEDKVKQIRSLFKSGMFLQTQLAEMFNVSKYTIFDVVNRRSWKHI